MEPTQLKIAIVGGGIAGSLAARVLREQHQVTIFERNTSATEVGAAINIGPNGVRILNTLGFDRTLAGSLAVKRIKTLDRDGKVLIEKIRDFPKEFGADWLFQHRADLHNEFLRLALDASDDLGIPGQPARIQYGTNIVGVNVNEGVLTFATGEDDEFDLIIAADGIRSFIRPSVVGDAAFNTARPSGFSAFRFTLKTSDIQTALHGIPECIDSSQPVTLTIHMSAIDKRTIVAYPCRDFQLLNFVCIVQDSDLKNAASESWTAEGDKEELLALFESFPEETVLLLSLANSVKLWQLRDQDPLPTYVKGRTLLIGDAAHAMTPFQGQGGTQAVEDAEACRLLLGPDVSRETVPSILREIDSVRRPRASEIQRITKQAANKKTAEDIHKHEAFNWTYSGIKDELLKKQSAESILV